MVTLGERLRFISAIEDFVRSGLSLREMQEVAAKVAAEEEGAWCDD